MRGEEHALARKAIELAKAGDSAILRFLLDRLLPKERSVRLNVPVIGSAADGVGVLAGILDAVHQGQIVLSEAAALAELVAAYTRALDVAKLEANVANLEQKLNEVLTRIDETSDVR